MEKFNLDNDVHELRLGKSFDKKASSAFHTIRYDFKPASVDTSQVSSVQISDNNSVTVSVPHVEGSGTNHTVYKGNKRPCQKECVLIIDHKTGQFTLEKLATTMQLKKTRLNVSENKQDKSKQRPISPIEPQQQKSSKVEVRPSPVKKAPAPSTHSQAAAPSTHSHNLSQQAPLFQSGTQKQLQNTAKSTPSLNKENNSSSDSSSSSSDSSDSEDEQKTEVKSAPEEAPRPAFHSTLSEDLCLSESGSDSD